MIGVNIFGQGKEKRKDIGSQTQPILFSNFRVNI